jgi:Raf kinase inhibitor-like YbhB/YbcL family protein
VASAIIILYWGTFPIMQKFHVTGAIFILITSILLCGCTSPATPYSPSHAPSEISTTPTLYTPDPSISMTLNVASLPPGSVLPDIYTCKGTSESPAVSWDGIPPGTKSLVLILDDPDAPAGTFTHWIVYNIPPLKGGLGRAQPNAKVLANGAQQGDTSAGSRGYYPVCPPIGTTHRYVFRLYAVDMDITQPTADRESIDWAMTGHTVAKTEVTTTFTR